MKESRYVIIVTLFVSVISTITACLIQHFIKPSFDYINFILNFYFAVVVVLITSFCHYFIAKRKIINSIYNAYFDVYKAYYYSKNSVFLFHYNSFNVYNKMIDMNKKITESLDEYYGFFRKHDSTYKKLNPAIKFDEHYKAKNLKKSLYFWFNKKSFSKFYDPLMANFEIVPIGINKKMFEKDKLEMIKTHKFLWGK